MLHTSAVWSRRALAVLGTLIATAASIMSPAPVAAQGTLSTQGFGYPGGQQSTRSLGAGGALGESDPFSATNPAAIYNFGGSVLYFQAEPEYRTLHVSGATEQTKHAISGKAGHEHNQEISHTINPDAGFDPGRIPSPPPAGGSGESSGERAGASESKRISED